MLFINLACALGQKVSWLQGPGDSGKNAGEINTLTDRALAMAGQAVALEPRWKERLRFLLSKEKPPESRGDNDLEVFADDPGFLKLLSS